MISYDDFKKLEIKIGKIVQAEKIEGSEKLVKLMVDLGEDLPGQGEPRQVVAGIALAYPNVQDLIGKEIPVLCNLEPKELMGITSYGMILAADKEGTPMLLHPEQEIPPGSIVK